MTTISVIIPTINEADTIANLVGQIKAQGFHEIIVADASATSATYDAALVAGARCLRHLPRGRGAQMQAGAALACGEILFFLHADSILPPNAHEAIQAALSDPLVAGGSFSLAFDKTDWRLAFYAYCSRLNFLVTTFGDQGLFMRANTFQGIGGYKAMALLEDLDIQQRLRRHGKFVKLPAPITTSARRFVRRGIVRQQILNVIIVLAYLCGVAPHALARWYNGRAPSL